MSQNDETVPIIAGKDDCPAILTGIAALTFVNQSEMLPVFIDYLKTNCNLTEEWTVDELRCEIRTQIVHLLSNHAPDSFDATRANMVAADTDAVIIVPEQ